MKDTNQSNKDAQLLGGAAPTPASTDSTEESSAGGSNNDKTGGNTPSSDDIGHITEEEALEKLRISEEDDPGSGSRGTGSGKWYTLWNHSICVVQY